MERGPGAVCRSLKPTCSAGLKPSTKVGFPCAISSADRMLKLGFLMAWQTTCSQTYPQLAPVWMALRTIKDDHMPLPDISPSELETRLRLHLLPELGPKRYYTLFSAFGCASSALGAPASAWSALGLPAACAQARRSPQVRDGASAALRWLERSSQHLLLHDRVANILGILLRLNQPDTRRFAALDLILQTRAQGESPGVDRP